MIAWASTWYYRVNQRLTPARPKWLHRLVCTHCRGISRWCREQRGQRRTPPVAARVLLVVMALAVMAGIAWLALDAARTATP